ncbi:hypothetical protein Hdeb2414_s0010g00350081 [Helianthus debilis subsp. tardiflorus]
MHERTTCITCNESCPFFSIAYEADGDVVENTEAAKRVALAHTIGHVAATKKKKKKKKKSHDCHLCQLHNKIKLNII